MSEDKNKNDGPLCTVGEQLNGIERLITAVLMQTELYDGYGAYKLSYAGGKSGFSFGPNQMDLSQKGNKHVTQFKAILTNAKDVNGKAILNEAQVNSICGKDNCNLTKTGRTPESIFGKNLVLINAALSSDYGITAVNNMYKQDLKIGLIEMDKTIADMKLNPEAQNFYKTDLGKVALFEYKNQFGIQTDSPFLHQYINGEANGLKRTDYSTHKKYSARTDQYTIDDHIKFIRSTKEWHDNKKAVENRLNKALKTFYKNCSVAEADSFMEDLNENFLNGLREYGLTDEDLLEYETFLASYDDAENFDYSPALFYMLDDSYLDDYLDVSHYKDFILGDQFNNEGFNYPSHFDPSKLFDTLPPLSPYHLGEYSFNEIIDSNNPTWRYYPAEYNLNNLDNLDWINYTPPTTDFDVPINTAYNDFDMGHYYDNNFSFGTLNIWNWICGVQESKSDVLINNASAPIELIPLIYDPLKGVFDECQFEKIAC